MYIEELLAVSILAEQEHLLALLRARSVSILIGVFDGVIKVKVVTFFQARA